jgi:uncharacterized repeat protein (TIGR02543 family)
MPKSFLDNGCRGCKLRSKIVPIALLTFLLLFGIVLQLATVVNAQYPFRYRLTISTNNQLGGYTNPGSGSIQIDYGLSYQVSATPNPGYVFNGWYLNGIYQHKLTITVTMIHDNALTATFSQNASSLTITVNPADAATINPPPGTLYYPYGSSVQVTVQPKPEYTFSGWYLDGTYAGLEKTITVTMTDNRQLSAYFGGASPTPPTPTPVQLPPANLIVSCQSSSTFNGFDVKINGVLTGNGTSIPNAGVLLYLSVTGGTSWDVLSFVNTASDGTFSVSWKPSVTGNYVLKVVWQGNSAYSNTSTIVNFAITPFEEQSVFSVTSNSTLSGLSFDSETKDLSFGTTGPSGTTGYVNVIIPKSLVADISTIKVFVDENRMSYNSVSQKDAWAISFTYQQSSHQVRLGLDETPTQSFNLPVDLVVIIGAVLAVTIAIAVVVVVLVKRRSS